MKTKVALEWPSTYSIGWQVTETKTIKESWRKQERKRETECVFKCNIGSLCLYNRITASASFFSAWPVSVWLPVCQTPYRRTHTHRYIEASFSNLCCVWFWYSFTDIDDLQMDAVDALWLLPSTVCVFVCMTRQLLYIYVCVVGASVVWHVCNTTNIEMCSRAGKRSPDCDKFILFRCYTILI